MKLRLMIGFLLAFTGSASAADAGDFFRFLEIGKFAEAENEIGKIAPPRSTAEAFLRAQLLFYEGRFAEARALLEPIRSQGPRVERIEEFRSLVAQTHEKTSALKRFRGITSISGMPEGRT